jgi:hypothetical protein
VTLPVPGVRSATELRGREPRSESWSRTSKSAGSKPARQPPMEPSRNGAVSRCRPGSPALQGQGHSRVRRPGTGASDGGRFRFTNQTGVSVLTPVLGVLGAIRTHTPPYSAACLCHWATRTRSLWTVSNRLPAPYERAALPGELQRRGWGTWIRTRTSVAVSRVRAGRVASYTIPH